MKEFEDEMVTNREESRELKENVRKLEGENSDLEDKLRVAVVRIADLEKEK